MSYVFPTNTSQPLMSTTAGGPFGNSGTINAPDGIITNADRVSMKDLDSEVFKMSVEGLVNIWITRFGNEWIDLVDIEQEPFYALVYKRLRSLGELEQHYLTDRSRFVCRKPE